MFQFRNQCFNAIKATSLSQQKLEDVGCKIYLFKLGRIVLFVVCEIIGIIHKIVVLSWASPT
jgi:hypothetical protein